jgi:hypothetical protein
MRDKNLLLRSVTLERNLIFVNRELSGPIYRLWASVPGLSMACERNEKSLAS